MSINELPLVNLYASGLICGKFVSGKDGFISSWLIRGWVYLPSFTVLDILKGNWFCLSVLHFYEKPGWQQKQKQLKITFTLTFKLGIASKFQF